MASPNRSMLGTRVLSLALCRELLGRKGLRVSSHRQRAHTREQRAQGCRPGGSLCRRAFVASHIASGTVCFQKHLNPLLDPCNSLMNQTGPVPLSLFYLREAKGLA